MPKWFKSSIMKLFPIFAVRHQYNNNVFTLFLGNYTIRRSFSHSFYSVIGGCRRSERATLFLFILIAIFLQMRQPVENNCTVGNNSTYAATPTNGETFAFLNSAQTLTELTNLLNVHGCTKINISFKPNKVTVGYCQNGNNYGARGKTFTEAFSAAAELLTSKH